MFAGPLGSVPLPHPESKTGRAASSRVPSERSPAKPHHRKLRVEKPWEESHCRVVDSMS